MPCGFQSKVIISIRAYGISLCYRRTQGMQRECGYSGRSVQIHMVLVCLQIQRLVNQCCLGKAGTQWSRLGQNSWSPATGYLIARIWLGYTGTGLVVCVCKRESKRKQGYKAKPRAINHSSCAGAHGTKYSSLLDCVSVRLCVHWRINE